MNTVNCLLVCGCWHRMPIASRVRDTTMVCAFHGLQSIVRHNSHEWHVRCTMPGCRYSRWFGADEGEARRASARHGLRYSEHFVGVQWDRVTADGMGTIWRQRSDGSVKRLSRKVDSAKLPLEDADTDDVPPF